MGSVLGHRGPDDEGMVREPGIVLGARRLALVDPAHGQQPVTDGDRFVAVVNGELFDHAVERERLSARGAKFRSRCDSEVWVHAFADEGEDYLARARGQFALAMWDRRDRRLVLARDRYGICPLYVAESDGWLVFASEIKALFAAGIPAQLDARAVDHVFACLCASPVRSAFVGVTPLSPGHRLVARGANTITTRFAGIEFPQRGWERRDDDATVADELERLLDAAVGRRLAADAPVATYLSGGVDSSLIVALAAKRGDVTAFSVALDGVGPDEADLAARTARLVGAEHVAIRVDAQAIGRLFPEVVIAAEVPILDHASCALLALSRAVRERGFKAVLTGEGADEAFAGYPWTTVAQRGGVVARVAGRGFGAAILGGGGARLPSRGAFASTGAAQLYDLTARARAFLYAASFWERLGSSSPADDHVWDKRVGGWHPLHQSLYADYECVLAGHLLADKGDRVAMASGVEPRFPYLDDELVALASSLAPSFKLRRGRDKFILREVARRYLPPEIALREKLMFRAEPVIHAADRPSWVDELLSPLSLRRVGLFDPDKVTRALASRATPSRHPRAALLQGGLTGVVSTQLLAHLFCGGGLCSLPAWSA